MPCYNSTRYCQVLAEHREMNVQLCCAKSGWHHGDSLYYLSLTVFQLLCCSSSTLARLHHSTSALAVPLPWKALLPHIDMAESVTLLRSRLKCYLIRKDFPDQSLLKIVPPTPHTHKISPSLSVSLLPHIAFFSQHLSQSEIILFNYLLFPSCKFCKSRDLSDIFIAMFPGLD